MNAYEKIALIQERLQSALSPSQLEVIDESDAHIGHAGHEGGGRHFAINIAAKPLEQLTRVEAHRNIYNLLSDLFPDHIHALKIKVLNVAP